MATTVNTLETDTEVFKGDRVVADGVERTLGAVTLNTGVYSTNFQVDGIDTALASIPTSVYRLDHDNLTIDGTPTATTATVLDSRAGLIASGDTVLLDGVGVVCNPVVETDVSVDTANSLTVGTATAIATYRFEDNVDDISTNFNGIGYAVTYPTGKYGKSILFGSSTSSYLSIPNPIASIPGTGNYSVSVWVKTTAYGALYPTVTGANSPAYIWMSATTITCHCNTYASYAHTIPAGVWTHLVLTNTGSTMALYVNGSAVTLGTASAWGAPTAATLLIGGDNVHASNSLNGSIDQLRYFTKTLTPTEATALYNETVGSCQYDLTYPTQTAPTRIALSGNDIVPTVASDTFDGTDTFTKTYNTVTKTARDVEYGFVADEEVEVIQLNINQNMEP